MPIIFLCLLWLVPSVQTRGTQPLDQMIDALGGRAFLDVKDTVRGFYFAATKGKRGEVYNLCATRTYPIREILRTAIRLSGVKAEVRPVARLMRPSDEKIIFGSTHKMRKDTGWRPLRSVEETLQSMLNYWDAAL